MMMMGMLSWSRRKGDQVEGRRVSDALPDAWQIVDSCIGRFIANKGDQSHQCIYPSDVSSSRGRPNGISHSCDGTTTQTPVPVSWNLADTGLQPDRSPHSHERRGSHSNAPQRQVVESLLIGRNADLCLGE